MCINVHIFLQTASYRQHNIERLKDLISTKTRFRKKKYSHVRVKKTHQAMMKINSIMCVSLLHGHSKEFNNHF